ncbi:putative Ig domain-containing protein [Lysobacter enzymogenes]|uniref:putative Ig domain-containing protein n=1 Tax=Lysobacter enzymogenes TaxID=69 RepID=UPI001AF1DA91|nr:putative Ig domain-containing protein [Lysobacter enzymogenes]QQQ02755.1 putative Ig domain-containing protein [Lysobacter enzymogenes]
MRSFGYNLAGHQVREHRLVATSDGQRVDAVTWNSVDRLGRVVATRMPAHTADLAATSLVQQRRDRWGNVLETVDTRGYRTNYRYNELDQVVRDERPLVEAVSETGASTWIRPVNEWFYDALGRLIGTRDANGNTRLNEYDAAGQLVRSFDAFGQATLYAYDALGQQRLVQSPVGRLTYQDYDKRGRIVETGDFLNGPYTRTRVRLQGYGLNQNGDRLSVTDALGQRTDYDYSSAGLVSRIQTATGQITWYGYDMLGRKTWENYNSFNGPTVQDRDGETVRLDELTWDYDVFGRLIDHNNLSGRDFDYAYDAVTGQLSTDSQRGGPVGDAVRRYTYYPNGRIKAIYENGADPTYRYEYDAAGNRTLEEVFTRDGNMTTWTRTITRTWYDSNNRVQRVVQDDLSSGASKRVLDLRYSYDAAGNRRRVSAGASYGSDATGVPAGNNAPVAVQAPPPRSVPKGLSSEFSIVFSEVFRDPEQDPLTLQIALADGSALPAWLTATRDGTSGRIVFVANPGAGVPDQDLTIRLIASETGNPANAAATTFVLYVRSNRPPQLLDAAPTPLRLKSAGDWTLPLAAIDYFNDTDIGDELRLSVDNAASLPAWVQFDAATMRLRAVAPAPGQTFALFLRATDRAGQSTVKTLHLSVGANTAPTGPSPLPAQAIVINQDFVWSNPLPSVFADADGDYLEVAASGLPAWMSFQRIANPNRPELRLIGRVPSNVPAGTVYTITFTANDGFGGSKTTTLTLTVRGGNRAPDAPGSFSIPRVTVGLWYSYQLPAFVDADGDAIAYRLSALPAGLSFDAQTRTISGVATAAGNVPTVYTATDPFGASKSLSLGFNVVVNDPPAPTWIPNQSAGVGAYFAYQIPLFTDPNGDTVTYDAGGLPPGLSISSGGIISGTPTVAGNYEVVIVGIDARGAKGYTSFVIAVNATPPPNNAPVRNYTPTNWSMEISEASVGFEMVYWPANAFVDPDGNPMTYQLVGSPSWVVYHPSTGPNSHHRFDLSPPAQTRSYTITVRATDSLGASVDMSFGLYVVYRKGGGVANAAPDQPLSFDMGPGEAAGDAAPSAGDALAASAGAATATLQYRDSWFTYDAENRIAINNGRLVNGAIVLTAEGGDSYRLDYDAAGNAAARTFYRGNTLNIRYSSYDLRGNLITEYHDNAAQNSGYGGIARSFTYDAANRLTSTRSYYANGSTWTRTTGSGQSYEEWETYDYSGWLSSAENYSYDAAGRLLYQDKIGRNEAAPNWIQLASQNNENNRQSTDVGVLNTLNNRIEYRDANGNSTYDAFGRATGFKTTTLQYTHTYAIAYEGWEGYQQKTVSGTSSNASYRPTTNTLTYDALGRLISQQETTRLSTGSIDDRVRYYAYNGDGQVQLRREGTIKNGQFVQDGAVKPNYLYAYAGGQQMAQIAEGSRIVSLNGVGMYQAGGAKVVALAGETLRTLAQRIYGNDLLWYVLAEANGLGEPDQEIGGGRELDAPRVDVSRNDANTFKPYDPGEAIGSTMPGLPYIPPAPGAKCGAMSKVISVIVTAVVSYFAGGAAGAAAGNYVGQMSQLMFNGQYDWGRALRLGLNPFGGNSSDLARSVYDPGSHGAPGRVDYKSIAVSAASAAATTGISQYASYIGLGTASSMALQTVATTAANYQFNKWAGYDVSWSNRQLGANIATAFIGQAMFGGGSNGNAAKDSASVEAPQGNGSFQWRAIALETARSLGRGLVLGAVQTGVEKAFGVKDASWNWERIATDAFGNVLANAAAMGVRAVQTKRPPSQAARSGNTLLLNFADERAAQEGADSTSNAKLYPQGYERDPREIRIARDPDQVLGRSERIARLNALFDDPLPANVSDSELLQLEHNYGRELAGKMELNATAMPTVTVVGTKPPSAPGYGYDLMYLLGMLGMGYRRTGTMSAAERIDAVVPRISQEQVDHYRKTGSTRLPGMYPVDPMIEARRELSRRALLAGGNNPLAGMQGALTSMLGGDAQAIQESIIANDTFTAPIMDAAPGLSTPGRVVRTPIKSLPFAQTKGLVNNHAADDLGELFLRSGKSYGDIRGAASEPLSKPPGGWPKSERPLNVDDIWDLADRIGLLDDRELTLDLDKVEFKIIEDRFMPKNSDGTPLAAYYYYAPQASTPEGKPLGGTNLETGMVKYSDLTGPNGKIPIRISESVAQSEMHTLHTVAHELYELSRLIDYFKNNGWAANAGALRKRIGENQGANFHTRAHDFGDIWVDKYKEANRMSKSQP